MPKRTGGSGEHVVTMREVAKAAGVSIKTVSNVVNDYEFVSQATRDKVCSASNSPSREYCVGSTITRRPTFFASSMTSLELGQDDVEQLKVDYPLVLVGERIFTEQGITPEASMSFSATPPSGATPESSSAFITRTPSLRCHMPDSTT